MSTTHHDHLPNTQDSSGLNPQGGSRGDYRGVQREGTALSRPLRTALLMVALVGVSSRNGIDRTLDFWHIQ